MPTLNVDFTGQAAIITGAGAGIGKTTALMLAKAGAAVLINDINPDRADDVVQEITEHGGRASAFVGDVSNRFQAAAMIEAARAAFGRIHILVNTAGVFKAEPASKVDEWDWRRALDVNLTGTFFCTQLMARVMTDEGGGVIINLASSVALQGSLEQGVGYVASKAGVLGITRQCAREYADANIRVNAVCPGAISDNDLPVSQQRTGTPEDVASAILFLCSDGAKFITGQTLVIDGGASLAN